MNEPTKYTKRPVTIEAMQFGPTPVEGHALTSWMERERCPFLVGDATDPESLKYPDQNEDDDSKPDKGIYIDPATGDLMIRTLEGDMRTHPGDFVIRGVAGEFYPCKPEIFAKTYAPGRPVDDLLETRAGLAIANSAFIEARDQVITAWIRANERDEPFLRPVSPYQAPLAALIKAEHAD